MKCHMTEKVGAHVDSSGLGLVRDPHVEMMLWARVRLIRADVDKILRARTGASSGPCCKMLRARTGASLGPSWQDAQGKD